MYISEKLTGPLVGRGLDIADLKLGRLVKQQSSAGNEIKTSATCSRQTGRTFFIRFMF